jgi:hypothetical protein
MRSPLRLVPCRPAPLGARCTRGVCCNGRRRRRHACRSFGTASRRVSRDVHADVGYAHVEVPKIELVVWPWRNSAKHLAAAAAAARAAEAEAAPPAGEGVPSPVDVTEVEGPGAPAAPLAANPAAATNSGANPYLPDYLVGAGEAAAAGSGRRRPARRDNPVQEQLSSLARHLKDLSGTWQAPTRQLPG